MARQSTWSAAVPRTGAALAIVLALLAAVLVGCSGTTAAPPAATTESTVLPLPIDFSKAGPYPVGTFELNLGDRQAVVYYPADRASADKVERVEGYSTAVAFPDEVRPTVPPELVQTIKFNAFRKPMASSEGPFPVVLSSHGYGSSYLFESRHFVHLASWGFVVAAPDHRERSLAAQLVGPPAEPATEPPVAPTADPAAPPADPAAPAPEAGTEGADPASTEPDVEDLAHTLQALRAENVIPDGPLRGALNLDMVAAEGHAAGGRAAVLVADDPAVKTFIGQAPAPPVARDAFGSTAPSGLSGSPDEQVAATTEALATMTPPTKPSLLIASQQDGTIPLAVVRAEFAWLAEPKTLTVLRNAGHNAYTDLCAPIRERGGLLQYTVRLPMLADLLRAGEDGCTPDRLDPDRGYDLINQVTIAHLRWVFRIDLDRISLDEDFLRRTFPDALGELVYEGGPTP